MTALLPSRAVLWQDASGQRVRAAEAEARVEPPTDADLLSRSGHGAQAAFGEVVHRHSRPLYAIAYRQLDSAADAEEIVQDAFLLLWRKRARVRFVGDSALPWLIVSVKHLAANRRRARMRRATHESAVAPESAPEVDLAIEQGEVADLLRRAFAVLAPLDAQVARLCLAEDVTYAEAAARLDITEGAVRNRLSRARRRLQQELEEDR